MLMALGIDLSSVQVAKAVSLFLLMGVLLGLRIARPLDRAKAVARYRAHRALRDIGAWFDAYVRRPLRWRLVFLQLKAVAFLMRRMRPEFRDAVWRWRQYGIPGMEPKEPGLPESERATGVAD
ncbi:MAG: hypothetical protein ACYC9Q_09230 [Bacillota bacterium]